MTRTVKVALIVGAVVLAGVGYVGANLTGLEQPGYRVVYEADGIEYRQYDSYLVSETVIERVGSYQAAGNEGFRRLFRYITGGNTANSEIAMTVPVAQTATGQEIAMTVPVQQTESPDGWRVAFMLPTEYTLETAPQPIDSRVSIREVPGRLTAVLRYSGSWSERNYAEKQAELLASLSKANVTPVGEVQSALYNAPFTPPFLRRNEVLVAVDRLPAAAS